MANIKKCLKCNRFKLLSNFKFNEYTCDRCIIKENMNFETAQQIILGTYDGWMKHEEMLYNIAQDFVIDHIDKLKWNE